MLAIIAAITRGGRLPDGTTAEVGSVVIWSGEDGFGDTLLPRLIAMGADRTRIYFVEGIGKVPFDPSRDMPELSDLIKQLQDVKLVLVDPIVSVVSGDSHKNAEVRRGLQPLVDLGKDTGSCIAGISHFSKSNVVTDPLALVSGSIAFGAVARVVIGVAKLQSPDEHGHSRIFCRIKSNIGPDEDGVGYDLQMVPVPGYDMEASTVLWGQYVKGHSRDLLARAQVDASKPDSKQAAAESFLSELLKDGAVTSKTVKSTAESCGHSWGTVRKAKTSLRILDYKEPGIGGAWSWKLPENYVAQVSCSNSIPEYHTQVEQHRQVTPGKLLNLPNLPLLFRDEKGATYPDAEDAVYRDAEPEAIPDFDFEVSPCR